MHASPVAQPVDHEALNQRRFPNLFLGREGISNLSVAFKQCVHGGAVLCRTAERGRCSVRSDIRTSRESGDRDKRFIGPALQKFVKVGAAAAFSTFRWHDVPATLQADDPGLSQRVFCEPCREIIILSTVVSKFKPPQS
jgi:hypothetical protein